jgi:putative PEP-CTERM system TPR-repeat lipoprotein
LQQQPGSPEARRVLGEIELWRQNPGAAAEQFERALRSSSDAELLALYAEALIRAGDLKTFSSLISQNYFAGAETQAQYLAALARSQAAQDKPGEARNTLVRALQIAPDSLPLRLAAAEIMSSEGGDIGAIAQELERIVADYPDSDRAWAYLGKLKFVMRDFDAAILALEKAITRNPNRFSDRVLYASALLKSGQIEAAGQLIEVLADVAPNAGDVNLLRAEFQLRTGNINEALISINKVLSAASRQPVALYLAGLINSEAGNLETARRNLMELLSIQSGQTDARLKLAAIQLALNEPQAAEESARTILEKNPLNTSATRILAAALAMMGNQAGSIEAYGRALELDPASNATATRYADVLTQSGDLEAGVTQLRAARDLEPASAETRAQLTAALLALGDRAGAIAEAEAFIRAYPENPLTHALAGSVAVNAGDSEAARRHFEEALSLDSGNIAANFGLASLAIEDGNFKRAEECYERVLAAHPDHLPTLLRMAVLSENAGDLAAMESRLADAIDRHPDAVPPRVSLARYRLSLRRYQDVVDLLTPVSASGGGEAQLHQLLATSYLAIGDYPSALTESRMLVDTAPGSAAALLLRARVEMELGRLAEAEDTLRAAAKLSDSPLIEEQLIAVLLKAEKFDVAREELERIPADRLTPWRYEFARGRIAESQGDDAGAAAAFARALAIEPQSHTLVARANALWRTGDQTIALSELNTWLSDKPEDPVILGHLANLYLLIGQDQDALRLFERLNTLQPGSPALLNNLAWAGRNVDPVRSLAWVQRAMELAPDSAGIQDTYSMVLLANGDAAEAMRINSGLQKKYPEQTELSLHGAEILAALGRDDDALEILNELIDDGKAADEAKALKARLWP